MSGITANKFYTETVPQILFLWSIIIDSVNGAFQAFFGIHLPIGIIFRGAMLILLFPKGFYLKGNGYNKFFLLLTGAYILCMLAWLMVGNNFSITEEAGILFRFIYFFVVLFYFYHYRNAFDKRKITAYVVIAATLVAVTNIYCFATDNGIKSYDNEFGFGVKAFFADGNSLGLYMVLSLCLAIWNAYYRRGIQWWLCAIVITAGTLLIGTRAALMGPIAAWAAIVLFCTFTRDRLVRMSFLKRLLVVAMTAVTIIYAIIPLLEFLMTFSGFYMDKFSKEALVSPREALISEGIKVIDRYEGHELVIGNGVSGGLYALGELYDSDGAVKSIEADFYDAILSYGWWFGSLMILINVVLACKLIFPAFRRLNSLTFTTAMIGAVWLFAAYIAGHGFFNTMLAPILGLTLVLANNYGYDMRIDKP